MHEHVFDIVLALAVRTDHACSCPRDMKEIVMGFRGRWGLFFEKYLVYASFGYGLTFYRAYT